MKGGITILIYCRIIHRQIILNTFLNSKSIEIFLDPDQIRISAVYKRSQGFLLLDDIDTLNSSYDWFVIAGDLNVKHPLWNSYSKRY